MTIDEIRETQTNLMNLKYYNIAPNVLTKAANGLEELKSYKELDLEIPQHFTKEQSAWIKKYCIEKNKEFYNRAIDDCIKAIKSIFIGTMFSTKEECNAFEFTQNKCIELIELLKGGGVK